MTARRMPALAALVLAGGLLSGCSLLGSLGGPVIPEGETDAFAIQVGDCLNDAEVGSEVTSVPLVDCAEPHDSEVYARGESAAPAFPGFDALDDELAEFCQGESFTEFIGIPYTESRLQTSGYFPSQESWADGDRELLCTVWDEDGRVSGSLRGSAE